MLDRLALGVLVVLSLAVLMGGAMAEPKPDALERGYHDVLYTDAIESVDASDDLLTISAGDLTIDSNEVLVTGELQIASGYRGLTSFELSGDSEEVRQYCRPWGGQIQSPFNEVTGSSLCSDGYIRDGDIDRETCNSVCTGTVYKVCDDGGPGPVLRVTGAATTRIGSDGCEYTCTGSVTSSSYVTSKTCTETGSHQEIRFDQSDRELITTGTDDRLEPSVIRFCAINLKEVISGRSQEIESVNMVPVTHGFSIRDCQRLATSSIMLHGTSHVGDRARYGVGCMLSHGTVYFGGYVHNNEEASAPGVNCGWEWY